MYQAPMSLKEIIVNRVRNYFFLNIMQHFRQRIFPKFLKLEFATKLVRKTALVCNNESKLAHNFRLK